MYALKVFPFSTSTGSPICAKCSLHNDVPKAKQNLVEKIRERITNAKMEISPSAYDTAWVAMVPSREYSGRPSFPQCLDWIMKNQNPNGSWGLNPDHPFLLKDSLSCTLACLLALSKWNTGNQLVQRGMEFIKSNGWAATHDNQVSPIGFDIVFPAMIDYAKELDLTLPLAPTSLHSMLQVRDSQIRKRSWEYVAEGLIGNDSCNWKQIIRMHQRSNGSLFNSPATTAAAAIHSRDDKCFGYLLSILKDSNGSVPTIYPINIHARLNMIDTLERLGIDRFFGVELNAIFYEIYKNWQEREEEIFSNVTCQALAFRLLRMKGYDVSSDELSEFVDEERFFDSISMQHRGADTVLELFRASQMRINEEESILEKIHAWTKAFLKKQLLNRSILDKRLEKQVEYDLKNFYGTLERFQNRRTIDLYDAQSSQIAKTAYRCSTVSNEDFIRFSVQDFKISRAQWQKEFEQILKWYSDCRLDLLFRGRNVCQQCYVLIAATIVDRELFKARISYTQVAIFITALDDFMDHYGSKEEASTIIDLMREWEPAAATYCSKEVEILFTALHGTINEIAAKAYAEQGFCSKQLLIDAWVEVIESNMNENILPNRNNKPTLEEYLSLASWTIGSKVYIMASIQFLGIKLSKEILTSAELRDLCRHAGVVGRLLNDLKSYKREREENTFNSVSVLMAGGGFSEEEAVGKLEEVMEYNRRKVMQLTCPRRQSILPRECRELVRKTCKLGYSLYGDDGGGDEFWSPLDILNDINAMMFEPLPNL